jgi:hypothetical protein
MDSCFQNAPHQSATIWPRHFSHRYLSCTQPSNSVLAEEARRILRHRQITCDGDWSPDSNSTYHLALNDLAPGNRAAIHIHNVPRGGSFRDLPGHARERTAIAPAGLHALDWLDRSGVRIREIAAVGATPGASPRAALGLVRHLIHEAKDTAEAWILGSDSAMREFFVKTLGSPSCMQLGDHLPCPSLIFPCAVLDNVLLASDIETSPLAKRNLSRMLMFLSQGIDASMLGPRVAQAVAALHDAAAEN